MTLPTVPGRRSLRRCPARFAARLEPRQRQSRRAQPDAPVHERLRDQAGRVHRAEGGQGRRGRWPQATALLIDVSTARFGQLQNDSELGAWLDSIPVDWEHSPFACVAICYSHPQDVALRGVCRYRPDIDPAIRDELEPVLTTMRLPPTG